MKDLNQIESWNQKQLRNLRINLNNRLQAFQLTDKPKPLQKSHVLAGMGKEECEKLLQKVKRLEKALKSE